MLKSNAPASRAGMFELGKRRKAVRNHPGAAALMATSTLKRRASSVRERTRAVRATPQWQPLCYGSRKPELN